jgi:hypothetical protein
MDGPDNLSKLINCALVIFVNGLCQQHTYPFDRGEHMHSRVSILWVQICVDQIRIDISRRIVVMIPRERPRDVVLIVTTSSRSFLAIGP